MELPLLSTKFAIPLITAEFIPRPRLVARLNEGTGGPLTVLAAPAGFGKTSLLAEWLRQSPLAIAWLTLDADDNDPPRFARYLVRALQTASPGLGADALEYFVSAKNGGTELALTVLINEIAALPVELALVLDEYHVVEDLAIHRSLNYLLTHWPHNLHLVVASRTEPALDLAFLRAKGWVAEFRPEDLRFTSEEVDQFLSQTMRLTLAPETVRELEMRTEGWVAGLQLAALSLRHRSGPLAMPAGRSGQPRYLVDFLAGEVLSRQPEDMRQFLLRSAILDELSGPLCEAVVESGAPPGYGKAMLDRLIASTLNLSRERAIPCIWKSRGEALAALHQTAEAEATFQAARETASARGAIPLLWRIHVALGKLYQAQRRYDDAANAFSMARTIVAELATSIPDERLRDNFVQRANALMPAPAPLTPRRAAKAAFGGLTARECEVAALVGQGKSNREIANDLVISERTVEHHVTNILSKLGLNSRAQVAVWAVEKGLADAEA
jgi:ATP/maltotriose-dependent transcriptional regulator MalT